MKTVNESFDPAYPISELLLHERNVNEGDIGSIIQSIDANGFYGSVVVQKSTNKILAGNHRFMAAQHSGADTIPVVFVDVDDDHAIRILLADNRTTRLGVENPNMLADLLQELNATPLGLSGTGYDTDALDALLQELSATPGVTQEEPYEPKTDPDDVPEVKPDPITKPGDLWILGRHRVMCGDCREFGQVERLFAGTRAHVVFTSPPYASQREYDKTSGFTPIPPDEYSAWYRDVAANMHAVLAEDGSYFLNIKEHCDEGQRHLYVKDLTISHVREWGWRFVDEFCWRDKKNGVPGGWPNRFKDAWEPVFHFCKSAQIKFHPLANASESNAVFDYSPNTKVTSTGSGLLGTKATAEKAGLARPSNVIEIAAASTGNHSAAFPVALPEWFIKAFSDEDDVVFDTFMGSGTTLIAAERTNRSGYGTEISPKYCDVIIQRWQEFTGKDAVLDGDGRTFSELLASRG